MNRIIQSVATLAVVGGVALGGASAAQAKPAVCADISQPAKVRLDAGCFAPDSGLAPGAVSPGDGPTVTGTVPNRPAHQLVYDPQEKIDAPRFMDFAVVPNEDGV